MVNQCITELEMLCCDDDLDHEDDDVNRQITCWICYGVKCRLFMLSQWMLSRFVVSIQINSALSSFCHGLSSSRIKRYNSGLKNSMA
eukprot:6135235-Amphidinium_carterae.3